MWGCCEAIVVLPGQMDHVTLIESLLTRPLTPPPFVRSMTSLEKAVMTVTVIRRSQKTKTMSRRVHQSPGSPELQGSEESSP